MTNFLLLGYKLVFSGLMFVCIIRILLNVIRISHANKPTERKVEFFKGLCKAEYFAYMWASAGGAMMCLYLLGALEGAN